MRTISYLLPALLLTACSDYGFSGDKDAWGGDDSGADEADADIDADADGDTDTDTDTDTPPGTMLDDCLPQVEARFEGGEIYVKSWDVPTAGGTLYTAEEGWFHVYDYSLAESGSAQTNEVSYLRIPNAARPDGEPFWSNCAGEWIVDDFDNEGDPGLTRIYTGTFWLEEGDNALTLNHYCPLERSGYCPEFHETSDPNSTCGSEGPNSVHFVGDGLCLVKAALPTP